MSLRIDPAEWITGALIIGATGLGVPGADVPSGGTHGPGLLYNDISLPAEAADEFRALILTTPAAGTLFVYEDSSLTFSGPDGVHTGTYEGFKNGVSYGVAGYSITLGSQSALSGTLTLGDFVLGGGLDAGAPSGLSGTIELDGFVLGGSMTGGSAPTVTITVTSDGLVPMPSLTGLKWAFFDQANPSLFAAPSAKGSAETTDASGVLTVDVTGTALASGATGWLVLTDSDGTTTQSPPPRSFCAPVTVLS